MEDAATVAQARAGDHEAFRVVVERHSHALFRLAFRMTGNEQDAEDVVQNAFLKAYRNLSRFEERAEVGSWLYRITANCAYDLLRSRQRRERAGAFTDAGDDEIAETASADPSPERLVASGDIRRRVEAAMGRMSARERAAFVLRHFEGRSLAEIGAALGTDSSATKQSVLRAVRKVREFLGRVDVVGASS